MNNEVTVTRCGNTEKRAVRLTRLDGSYVGTITTTKSVSNKGKKRKLDYSFKQISAKVLDAKTSTKAEQVAMSIGVKLNLLYKRAKNSEYDEEEVARAILHAEEVLRACRKKQKHLKIEETAEQKMKDAPVAEEQENPVEEAEADNKEQELEQEEFEALMEKLELDMEEMTEKAEETAKFDEESDALSKVMSGEMEPRDLEELKAKHRSEEQRDILKADLKYLKALFDRLQAEKDSNSKGGASAFADSGVVMAFDGADIPVATDAVPQSAEGQMIDASV